MTTLSQEERHQLHEVFEMISDTKPRTSGKIKKLFFLIIHTLEFTYRQHIKGA